MDFLLSLNYFDILIWWSAPAIHLLSVLDILKTFIRQVLIFFVPIIVLSFVLDFYISNQLKKSKTHAFREYPVWNDINAGNINADLLIMGSSRAWRHIDPNIIDDSLKLKSYNLGMDGQHLPMQLWRYETFLQKNNQQLLSSRATDGCICSSL